MPHDRRCALPPTSLPAHAPRPPMRAPAYVIAGTCHAPADARSRLRHCRRMPRDRRCALPPTSLPAHALRPPMRAPAYVIASGAKQSRRPAQRMFRRSPPNFVKYAPERTKKTITMKTAPNLVWMDLEMSGREPDKDVILEIATIVTGPNLDILAEGPVLAVHQGENIITGMDDWNTRHHTQSGLVDRVRRSQYSIADCEKVTLDFIKKYTVEKGNLLCGNSIAQDRRFIYKYMPKLANWLCYRSVDVTSVKELALRWFPNLPEFEKQEKHQALDDIRESIAELEYYKKTIFHLQRP